MNPVYAVMEHPHRWLILAGLSFGAGFVGAIAMIAYNWPHQLARVWFYLGFVLALYCLVQVVLDWHADVLNQMQEEAKASSLPSEPPD